METLNAGWNEEQKSRAIAELNELRDQLAECQYNNDVLRRRLKTKLR